MPKFDAFGREIGEDTLSGLGGGEPSADATPQATPIAPSPVTPPPLEAPGAPQPTFSIPGVRRRRNRGLGCLIGLVVLAAVVAGPVIAIVSLVGSAGDAIDEVTGALETPPGATPELPAPPAGITGRSMVVEANFAKGLRRLGGLGAVTTIRLSPDRIAAELVKGRRRRGAVVSWEGGLERGSASPAIARAATIPISAIDAGAPERLVRGSAERYRAKARNIDYLVLRSWPGEGPRWVAYFKNGTYVLGDAKGRVVRRIG